MSELWREKADYKQINIESNIEPDIAYNISDYLPYERLYKTLNQAQLQELIQDAKRFHWQALDLWKCGLETLPEELGNLQSLKAIDIGNGFRQDDSLKGRENSFSVLPKSFSNLVNLQRIDLEKTRISMLPTFIGNFTNLQRLSLRGTQISILPNFIGNFINLQRLYCSDTKIIMLPDSFGDLLNLQELSLRDTRISVMPGFIGNLVNLRGLSLSNTNISTLPDSFCNLIKLQRLDLSNTQIEALPDSFGNLVNLKRLYLNGTQIDALPDFIANLTGLQGLSLSNTRVNTLPNFVGNLVELQWLDLRNTKISVLPNFIGDLTNLQALLLDNTQISMLPENLQHLLQRLYLDGTPISEKIPPEIRRQSNQEIIHYIQKVQSNTHKRYLKESKMVIVGQGNVGKSCLMNRLLHDKFENQHTTEGIDIEQWEFTGKSAGIDDGEKYVLNVWDFGGQEIYHATHQFFLTHRTLYILVWDVLTEDDYSRRDYWMRTIQSFAGDSPVIVVVNKCDKDINRRREIEYAFLDRYPQIKERWFFVSCKDDGNPDMAELRRYILSESVKLPLMKTIWLDEWLSVREELETLAKTKSYIYYDEYQKICKNWDIQEEEALSLIKYLHDLGVVLHFHEDSLLCGLVILSPEWGTKAVYRVLDEQERTLKGRNGILYYKDLPNIWRNRTFYPEHLYPYLLQLMEKFQLAFKVDNTKLPENTYLVAELLSENPVNYNWPSEGTEPLAFRYTYDFLPAGVMTRLIVSIHQYLETVNGEKQCWRKGAYLVHRSAQAKVTLYDGIDQKYLDIRVIGDVPRDRRELLTIIREHVKKINDRFHKIKITEQVPCKCSLNCPHFFKYETLLKAENMQIPKLRCDESILEVSVSKLLDGVEYMEDDKEKEYKKHHMTINMSGGTIYTGNITGNHSQSSDINNEVQPANASANNVDVGKENMERYKDFSETVKNWSETLKNIFPVLLAIIVLLYLLATNSPAVKEWLSHILESSFG